VSDRGVFNFLRKALKVAEKENAQIAFGNDQEELQKLMVEARKSGHFVGSGRLTEFRFSGSQTGSRKLTRLDFEKILEILAQGYPLLKSIEFSIPPPPKVSECDAVQFVTVFEVCINEFCLQGSPVKVYGDFPSHRLKGLTSVHILNARWLNDEVVCALADNIGGTIQHLSLNGSEVSDRSLKYLISLCTHLRTLNLSGSFVSNEVFHHLVQSPCAATLVDLDVSFSPELNDAGLLALCISRQEGSANRPPQSLPCLRKLSIAGCPFITFMTLVTVIKSYAPPVGRLVHFDITGLNLTYAWDVLVRDCEEAERSQGSGFPWITNPVDERLLLCQLPDFNGVNPDSAERLYTVGAEGLIEIPEQPPENVQGSQTHEEDEDEGGLRGPRWRLKAALPAYILKTQQLMTISRWSGPRME
jgi:hypothetical protein